MAADRAFEKLERSTQSRIRKALGRLAADLADRGRAEGRQVKTIRGVRDDMHRLRVGDYRVMFEAVEEGRVVIVLGIVHRGDLGRWLRSR